jgi:hypothetical protein
MDRAPGLCFALLLVTLSLGQSGDGQSRRLTVAGVLLVTAVGWAASVRHNRSFN